MITKEELVADGWVIDQEDPFFPITKDLVNRENLDETDDPDDHVLSLAYTQMNGSGLFGILVTGGGFLELNIQSMEEMKFIESRILGFDPGY